MRTAAPIFFSTRIRFYISIRGVRFASDRKSSFENCFLDTDTPLDTREVVFPLRDSVITALLKRNSVKVNASCQVARIAHFIEHRRCRSSFYANGGDDCVFFADQSKWEREILIFSAWLAPEAARPTTCDKRNQTRRSRLPFTECTFARDSSIPLVLETSTLWCVRALTN
jgi:hypothetical protein